MRTCCKCGASFLPTGNGYRCPPCRKDYDRAWRKQRKSEGKPVSGSSMPREYHRTYEKAYRQQPEVRDRLRERARARRNDPAERHKHIARWKVNRAIASGQMVKHPCVVCGLMPAQAHHQDYSRPLDVTWLCATHHAEEHAKAEGRE